MTSTLKKNKRKLLCVVMDGMGHREESFGNAIKHAYTPTLDYLQKNAFSTLLNAHGPFVGLESMKDMGNSEVGHNIIGAGRIFPQGAKRVQKAFLDQSIFDNTTWQNIIERSKQEKNSCLHFIGLLSDGNVHSHEQHLHQMLNKAWEQGCSKIRVHILLDGRDVKPQSALEYVQKLEDVLSQLKTSGCDAAIASGGGRMSITMDRYEADWSMLERAWDTHVLGKGELFSSAKEAILAARKKQDQLNDQYLPPFVICDSLQHPLGPILDGDSVVLFNFRGDRAIELCRCFEEDDAKFPFFKRQKRPDVFFAGMMQYDGDTQTPKNYLIKAQAISHTLSEYMCALGIKQFACSETQKFGHVSYFWNGNRSGYFDKKIEKYLSIPSDIIEFDQKPWMKAKEITDATIKAIEEDHFDFLRINFANGDMVGHTGDFQASVIAVSVVDQQINRLLKVCNEKNYILMVTADHGNCEDLISQEAQNISHKDAYVETLSHHKKTSHTLSKVPFYVFDPSLKAQYTKATKENMGLANIANTILHLMGMRTRDIYLESIIE